MRCFIVVKDETGYNGDRTYPKVFKSKELAEEWCKWETEKAEDWYQSTIEIGERVNKWVPSYYTEESELEMSC